MLQAFYHGRLVINPFDKSYDYYPDLDLVPKVNDAYDTMYAEESDTGQKNRPFKTPTGISCVMRFIFFMRTTALPRRRNGSLISVATIPTCLSWTPTPHPCRRN